jgi:elongation factor G
MHSVDSNDAAFRIAALMAFKKGFMDASPQLLEPIYEIIVSVPAQYMGDVISDISTRRGQIQATNAEGSIQKIKAEVPLDELDHYATGLKSITHGSAGYSRSFSRYSAVPREKQAQIINQTASLEEA